VEIADSNEDGYGEVVFTTLNRMTMPLIRYRNRDISRIIDRECPCGVKHRRLERMRGRADEMVVASGGNLYPLMFEDILKDVEGITSDWQIVFRLRDIKEVMEFNLEMKDSASKDAVRQKIFDNIKTRYPDLWKNLSINIFETEFVCHAPGSLRAERRKLLRMVDKRYVK
jgi:phenylacetate-CoA ligase